MPAKLLPPVSFQLAAHQLAWLDSKRHRGTISRSAALRQVLDDLMTMEQSAAAAQPEQADG